MDAAVSVHHAGEAEQQACKAKVALEICIRHNMAAEDVARLWTGSRSLQQLCGSRLSSALLVRSVAAAARAANDGSNSMQALRWLLREPKAAAAAAAADHVRKRMRVQRWQPRQPKVTAAMINKCSQQLLAILCVPLAAAKALVRAGLRVQITSQQLVARAYKGFEGLGVWLEAFSAAGVPLVAWTAELPAELRPVCRGSSAFSDQVGSYFSSTGL